MPVHRSAHPQSTSYDTLPTPLIPDFVAVMFKFTMFSIFSVMFTLFTMAFALPIVIRDVFVPPVTSPSTGDVWTIGTQQNVTWCASRPCCGCLGV